MDILLLAGSIMIHSLEYPASEKFKHKISENPDFIFINLNPNIIPVEMENVSENITNSIVNHS